MKYTGQMRLPSRYIFIQKGVNQKEGVDEVMAYNFRFPGKYLIQYLTYLFKSLCVFCFLVEIDMMMVKFIYID